MAHRIHIIAIILFTGSLNFTVSAQNNSPDPFEQNARLGKGMNFGNALESPNEGDWGVTLKAEYFKAVKDAGFDSVRIPIRWSSHALAQPPYTIDPNFFSRIDWAVKTALENKLYVMLNMHHYMELMTDPNANSERFIALWKQIAEHYKNSPDSVLFEPLNEPHNALTADLWNRLLAKTIPAIRQSNPNRTLVINPANYASDINNLQLPETDRNIIVSCHYYLPIKFTHQGAPWSAEAKDCTGTKWTASEQETKEIDGHFDIALGWSKKFNRPINLGEFGTYYKAEKSDRVRWTAYIAQSAAKRGFSYIYWEFCSGFGIYDSQTNKWDAELLNAIISAKK
jgi:endoglucanase